MTAVKFTVPETAAMLKQDLAREIFFTAMQHHYDFLLSQNFPGSAWFRYRADLARQALEKDKPLDPNEVQAQQPPSGRDPFERNYSLFTGGRAISENLQLDRQLQTLLNQPRTIDISGVSGITTTQIDWKSATEGLHVEKDPLAAYIPADQHAVFCPTFKDMMVLMNEMKDSSTPLKELIEAETCNAQTTRQYEQQMCLGLDAWSRFWGPKTICGVAFTGSDPYFRVGADSAILFDARMTELVCKDVLSRQEEAAKTFKKIRTLSGKIKDIDYVAVVSPDRAICSYLAKVNNVVVVTNSLAQLEKIIQTAKGGQPSIAPLDEYAFFRNRYDIEQQKQTAFVILTDAAIRRWCGPKWKIAAARRIAAAAILSQLQAEYLDHPDTFDLEKARQYVAKWIPDMGTLSMTDAGVTSSTYGNLQFMTPISELAVDKISEQENSQYARFRENYQRRWRNFFDPIALCMLLDPEQFDADLSIRPLIASSDYREFMRIGGKNTIESGDGDPHPESILQLILAIDANSEPIRQIGNFANQMTANQQISTLSWLGSWITIYADDSPFWEELSKKLNETDSTEIYNYLEENINRVPLAVMMDVDSPAKLTVFLVSLRAFIQQTAPDMTTWETLTYKDKSYVRIIARYNPNDSNPPSLYYAITPEGFMLTLNESLIHQALDRTLKMQNANASEKVKTMVPWLGKNLSVRANEKAWKVVEMMAHRAYSTSVQLQSWNNLPILREWHTHKGKQSELEFHNRYWHTTLVCPGGGDYVWNEQSQTVESTVFGCPAHPKLPEDLMTPFSGIKDAQAGITFEEDGLRAKMKIERTAK